MLLSRRALIINNYRQKAPTGKKKTPFTDDDGTPLVKRETKLTGDEDTMITPLKLDTTAYHCRRKKILLLITKRNTQDA
jgi:hypothetical protein